VQTKYHMLAYKSQKQFTNDEATSLTSEDIDYLKSDLWQSYFKGERISSVAHA
jgi:catalase